VDGVRIPLLGRLGQRVSWLIFTGLLVMAAITNLAFQDPGADIFSTAVAAILVGVAGATFDIVIDGYRIELLEPRQLGVGSGMSQYGWRIGSVTAGALALVLASRIGWDWAYFACSAFALPAMITGLIMGEPKRHREPTGRKGIGEAWVSIIGPFSEFFMRVGPCSFCSSSSCTRSATRLPTWCCGCCSTIWGYSNDEIAIYDVGAGFWAYLVGIFRRRAYFTRRSDEEVVLLSLC
jgi:PAT family beta-lactamase induction signal transducer AmpG